MSSTFVVPEKHLSTRALISKFLALPRFAVIGVSRNPKDFSRMMLHELLKRGYDAVPVNPALGSEVEGRKCYASVRDITPPVSAALIMTSAEMTDKLVAECAECDIDLVWMHRATGRGAVSDNAVAFCREHGIEVIPGECPFMFLPKNGFHAIHGFIRKLTGSYPH
ncbi:MAG TPA: CoA-binding protein [Terriglobales bacterium]